MGEEVLRRPPVGRRAELGACGTGREWQLADQHPESSPAQRGPEPGQLDPVDRLEVGFDGLSVLAQESVEANASPTAAPVWAM